MRRLWNSLGSVVLATCLAGCASVPPARDIHDVSQNISARMGAEIAQAACNQGLQLPNGIAIDDGLTEEEAILIALWNNAAFYEKLAELGIVQGDLVQAGLLPNPELIFLFHVPDKPYRYAFEFPLEALWLRPIRLRAAGRESARVCEQLTQAGLDLIRDARQAYADLVLAHGRLTVAQEAVRIRSEVRKLAEARLLAGDISPQESGAARIDAYQAQQDLARIRHDVDLSEEKLRNVLGMGDHREPLKVDAGAAPSTKEFDPDALTKDAEQTRPDLLAIEESIAAAAERVRLAKLGWVRFLGIGDATAGDRTGHELGPAARFTIPIFNWNQGNIARAEAEMERFQRQRETVRQQIVLEVRQSCQRYFQARAEMDILRTKVKPEVETALRLVERAYREGNTGYVVVLETARQFLDSRLRDHQLEAELRRSFADLERSVGRRIDTPMSPNGTQP